MTEVMVKNWNKEVLPEDTVYHLGDFCFWRNIPLERVQDLVRRLNGTKHLILGNHDDQDLMEQAGFDSVSTYRFIDLFGQRTLLFHYPIYTEEHLGHMELIGETADKYRNRYKMLPKNEPWELLIHGHIHSGTTEYFNHLNVAVERQNYTPISKLYAYSRFLLQGDY